MTTKTCSRCGEEKPATTEYFYRHRNGLRAACKVCIKQHYQANREKILEQQKQRKQAKRAEQPACVYQIVNNQNGRIYVGETIRGELRWKEHLRYLRGGYHENSNLQEDFNKFGEEVFEWSIIKELPKDREVLTKEEKLHIDSLIAEGKSLYNVLLVS